MTKIKCAVIGSGNIGTDLIYKIQRSKVLEPVWMVGIDAASEGLARARDMGMKTTADRVDGLLPYVQQDEIQIAFDATSAYVHAENSRKLNELGVMMIDLTPAAIGPLCVPTVNLREHAQRVEMNVNMISCAGQATIPIVNAVVQVQAVDYAEIVASLASRSVGPGTRANLDEFTYTTSGALVSVGGARRGKALGIINPADPPMIMRNTIILVDQIDHDIAAGHGRHRAIIDATVRRARPVLLTALAAILGMIPLARSIFWGPMAITIMGGLFVATLLTLLVVPALYALWFRVRADESSDKPVERLRLTAQFGRRPIHISIAAE